MLYRSPWTRWILALSGLIAGLLLTFGDGQKWRATPSLHWLAEAGIPLQVWGVLLIIYAALLAFTDTRPIGYALGCFLFAVFTFSLIATMSTGPKNIITVAAMVDTVVFHAFSIRTAWMNRLAA